AAVTRVVISMRRLDVAFLGLRAVGAFSWRCTLDLRSIRADPRDGRGDDHQVAAADWALAGILFGDDSMNRTAPDALGGFVRLRKHRIRRLAGHSRADPNDQRDAAEHAKRRRHHPVVGMWKPAETASRAGQRVVTAFVLV